MYRSTPAGPPTGEAGLIPARILLDYRQRKYAYRLLILPDENPTKSVLPITLRLGDGNAQPGSSQKMMGFGPKTKKLSLAPSTVSG